jgi:hypothetical protein
VTLRDKGVTREIYSPISSGDGSQIMSGNGRLGPKKQQVRPRHSGAERMPR